MAERKVVTINIFRLESAVDTFAVDLGIKLDALVENSATHGTFDGKACELMFKVFEPIRLDDRTIHCVGICRQKYLLPVWYSKEGEIKDAAPESGALGEISYALIDTKHMSLVCISRTPRDFADFTRWLTGDTAAGITPLFNRAAYDQVNQWEIFRKLNLSIEAPAADFVDNILDSELGENFCMLEALNGLKIEITVSMGHGKGSLHKDAVRRFIKQILEDNFAGKLKIMGKSFEEQQSAEIDLYNARLKHKTEIVIAGTYIAPEEAKSALYEAYQLNLDDIFASSADGEED